MSNVASGGQNVYLSELVLNDRIAFIDCDRVAITEVDGRLVAVHAGQSHDVLGVHNGGAFIRVVHQFNKHRRLMLKMSGQPSCAVEVDLTTTDIENGGVVANFGPLAGTGAWGRTQDMIELEILG